MSPEFPARPSQYKLSEVVRLAHPYRLRMYGTVLFEDDLEELKKRTGKAATSEAIAEAVYHYLECEWREEHGD